jgi:hypothetical protein
MTKLQPLHHDVISTLHVYDKERLSVTIFAVSFLESARWFRSGQPDSCDDSKRAYSFIKGEKINNTVNLIKFITING